MKLLKLTILLIISSLTVQAQDTITYNKEGKKISFNDPSADYYIVRDSYEEKGIDSISRRYNMDGQLTSEKTFDSNKGKMVYQGSHKYWYKAENHSILPTIRMVN